MPEGEVGALFDHRGVVYHFDADAREMLSGALRRRARLPEPCSENFAFPLRLRPVFASCCIKVLMTLGSLPLDGPNSFSSKRPQGGSGSPQ